MYYYPPEKVQAARRAAVGTATISHSTLWNLIDTGQPASVIKVLLYLHLIKGKKLNPTTKQGREQIGAALGLSSAAVGDAVNKLKEGHWLRVTETSFIEFAE